MRGEYTFRNIKDSFAEELPPRARRIHVQEFHPTVWGGTTSACAENTAVGEEGLADIRNYLRVRGEYVAGGRGYMPQSELPPRARRIQDLAHDADAAKGTTSACAENTPLRAAARRVISELPPRARRIRGDDDWGWNLTGTTSACAENTIENRIVCPWERNYLRVRGEYESSYTTEKL